MASPIGLFCSRFFVVVLSISTTTSSNVFAIASRVFKVGGDLGWVEPLNKSDVYSLWASRNRFQVGDSLSFEYKNDSVIEVDKWGYYHCNGSQPIVAFNNIGNSLFKLDRPGPFCYISGIPNHCNNGQRLLVEVMGFHHHGSHYSPPYIAAPPESYLSPSPQPSSALVVSVSIVSKLGFVCYCFCYFFVHLLLDCFPNQLEFNSISEY